MASLNSISSLESAFLLVSTKNTDSGHFLGRKSANHGLPVPLRRLRNLTTVVVNGYKNGPSLRLRINWKWPKSVFLVLTKRKADSGDEIGLNCDDLYLENHPGLRRECLL